MMEILNETPFAHGMLFTGLAPGEEQLTVIVKGTFDLEPGSPVKVAEPQLPLSGDKYLDEDPEKDLIYEDDFAPFKPRADLLLAGAASARTFRVGQKQASLDDFGPQSRSRGHRAELAGSMEDDWFQCHWPRLGEDCPWEYFNAAPEEMTLEGYLRGDESLTLESGERGDPAGGALTARLPGLAIRSFLQHGNGEIAEVPMNLDTLWVDPAEARLILLWRGRTAGSPYDLEENGRLLIAGEALDKSQPASVYEARLSAAPEETPEAPEPSDPMADMNAVLAELGQEPAAMPEEFGAFMSNPETGASGLNAVTGLDGSGAAVNAQLESIVAVAAGGGLAGALVASPVAAAADTDFTEQSGTGDSQLAPLETQSVDSLPVEIAGFTENPAAGSEDLAALLKTDESPFMQKMAAEIAEAPAIPSAEEIDQAMASVPEWPPRNEEELGSMETLTAVFGSGRAPEGDGAGFLSALNGLAEQNQLMAESADAAGSGEGHVV